MPEGQVQQPNEGGANEGAAGDGKGSRVPANESKADKFRRLLNDRGPKVTERFAMLMQIFEPKNYEYTAEQVEKIFDRFEEILKNGRAEALAKLEPAKEKSFNVDLSDI
ncbi:MAG: hypothetical protein IBJ15_02075 [Alphaproteobacteria bacterium]|nr:hypothetical protein [Alphaproteobacteria bacterium]